MAETQPPQAVRLKSSQVPAQSCPMCAAKLDGITGAEFGSVDEVKVDDGKPMLPRVGSITICAYCCAVLVFGADMTLKLLSEEEQRQIALHDPDLWCSLQTVLSAARERHARNAREAAKKWREGGG